MKELTMRPASEQDVDTIYEWANDPVTRSQSWSTEPIVYENHVKWFMNRIKATDRLFYIFFEGDEPVGSVRLDPNGEGILIMSCQIAPSKRGQGYGQTMFKMIDQMVYEAWPDIDTVKLTAEVRADNIGSCRCLDVNGYSRELVDGVYHYWRDLLPRDKISENK